MIRSFAITLFVFQIGFGQNFKQTTFNSTNGLTSPSIFCIKKDKQGYIWLGTNTGVVRYDGKDFVQFELKDGLTAYSVYQIEEDKEGKIWFMTDTGEPNYYFKGQFYNPSNTKILSKLVQPSFLYGFAIDNQNNTWIGSFNDGVKVLTDGGDIINCEDFKTIPIAQKRIIKIWPFLTNQAIIAGGKYIYCLDISSKEKSWEIEVFEPSSYLMRCNKISENQILAFCANEVAIVDILKKKVIKKWHLENIAEVIYVGDPQNNQNLIGTRNGLYVFENSTISAHKLNSKLSAFAICDILKDDFGNIWVATLRNGLIKFGNYPIKKDPRFESIVDPISSFHFDSNGALLIGTQGTNFYIFKESLQSIPFKDMTSVVHSIIELNTDEFLIFAENRVDYVKGSEKHTLLCAIKAVQITEDKQTLYLGHALGTTKINTKVFLATIKNKDESILPTLLENNLNSPKYVNSLVLENQNRLIIGSKIGLSIWENGITKQYSNPELSSKLYVFKIQMLKPNIYALGTLGNGLVIVNTKTDKITNINTANDLADNFVTNLFVAPTGKIWIRHNLGLSSANLLDGKPEIKNYGSSDGLDNSVVYAMTSFEGKMLIGTGSGIYSFTELEMEQFRSLPSIFRFETLRINQKSTQIEDDLVYISSGEDFSINFDFINYNLGDKITYSYRLKDFSNTWLQTESEQISYSGLKSGTYDFEVFAKNDVGNRSTTSTLKIVVNNPWYRTTLARFTFLLLFVGFTFGLFKAKILNVDKKELKELWTKLKDIRKKSPEEMSLVVKKTDGSLIKIKHTDLTHISAAGNYVEYHTATGNHLSRATMKEVEEMLKDFSSFIRIHRSHFVNIQYVQGLYQNKLRLDKFELPIGNKYFKQIESIFEKT